MVVVAGCSEPVPEISIGLGSTHVSVQVTDANCECEPRRGCWTFTDVGPRDSSSCTCATPCEDSWAQLIEDGVRGDKMHGYASWSGDHRGDTLVVGGCGQEVQVELPTTPLPEPPVIVANEPGGYVEWTPPAGTQWTSVGPNAGAFEGSRCRVDGDITSVTMPAPSKNGITVDSRQRYVLEASALGDVVVEVRSSASTP